eukprot:TRINITY_DN8732_c0_g1_i1.p1 TRINITY_DN8732_c0_g1~~TRINITY_DN8732_c0_g1_i1.p1  ORF type:complete len:170 (-),score=36.67 TRINITY_DN8732_c0_g1_i1:670-1134(-)
MKEEYAFPIAKTSSLERHVDCLRFSLKAVPENPSLLAVGSSRLTGQTWDGSIEVYDLKPRTEGSTADPFGSEHKIASFPTTAGVATLDWLKGTNSTYQLVSGGDDSTIRLWSLDATREKQPEEISALTEHDDVVITVESNPVGESFLSGSWDHT